MRCFPRAGRAPGGRLERATHLVLFLLLTASLGLNAPAGSRDGNRTCCSPYSVSP